MQYKSIVFLVSTSTIVCGVLSVISCAAPQTNRTAPTSMVQATLPTKPPLPANWDSRWLGGIPCRAPCWEGITPGHTSASEAVDILSRSPIMATAEMTTTTLMPDLGYLNWHWADGTRGGTILYHAKSATQIIYYINPALPKTFKLSEVIQAFGEPSQVIATAGHGPDIGSGISRDLTLIYLPQGFALPVEVIPPKLSPDMVTFGPVFFAPTEQGLAEAIAGTGFAVPWQGFKDYEFYCRDLEGGRACRGK